MCKCQKVYKCAKVYKCVQLYKFVKLFKCVEVRYRCSSVVTRRLYAQYEVSAGRQARTGGAEETPPGQGGQGHLSGRTGCWVRKTLHWKGGWKKLYVLGKFMIGQSLEQSKLSHPNFR